MGEPWGGALERMRAREIRTAQSAPAGFPHFADPATGAWTCSPAGDWTGGFWNGMLWLSAFATGEARLRQWAEAWTERLRPRAQSDTVFRGFLFYYGAALGDILMSAPLGREVGLEGIAQVDLEEHRNRNQPLAALTSMALAVLATIAARLEREGRLIGPASRPVDTGEAQLGSAPVERPPLAGVAVA